MLEIILIVVLCKKMGSILREKGWETTFWMQLLVVVVYLASLFLGTAAYAFIVALTKGPDAVESLGFSLYLAAYVGAAIGVGALFLSTKLIKQRDEPSALARGFEG